MTDRERVLVVLDGISSWDDEPIGRRDMFADAMLEFAANEVETCVGDPTFRAEELRAQICRQVADPNDCAYVFDSGRKR